MTLRDTRKQRAIDELWDALVEADFYEPAQCVEDWKQPDSTIHIGEAIDELGLDKLTTKQVRALEKLVYWCGRAAANRRGK